MLWCGRGFWDVGGKAGSSLQSPLTGRRSTLAGMRAGLLLLHSHQFCSCALHQACHHHVMRLTVSVALSCRAKTLAAGYIITTIADMILIVCVGAYQTGDAALHGGAFSFMQG